MNCVKEVLQGNPPSHHCFANNWGASKISSFPISSHYRVVKVLLKAFIKILCPYISPSLHHSEGIFLAVIARNCDVYVNEDLVSPKERIASLFTFKILINVSPPHNDSALPLTTSLKKAIVGAIKEKKAEPLIIIGLAWLVCISISLLACCVKYLWMENQSSGSSLPPEMKILDRWKPDLSPSAPTPPTLRAPTWRLPATPTTTHHQLIIKTTSENG